jgi:hypothetical protein
MKLTAQQQANFEPGICTTCGADSPAGRNSAGQCSECHNRQYYEAKAKRKDQLDAMPRCEIPGCKRRATWIAGAGDKIGICGKHLHRAQSKIASQGIIGALCSGSLSGKAIANLAR